MSNQSKLYLIDLFCGAGGVSTGALMAGVEVIACVNHDENAIKSHAANHPHCIHYTEDIRTLNLDELVKEVQAIRRRDSKAIIGLWASLECTNFSRAKGGLPRDADSRTLAEHLIESENTAGHIEPRYIPLLNPDVVYIENVEEFMAWGPLDDTGRPISKDAGCDYVRWVNRICRQFGYKYEHRILNAADFGAVQRRKRFFAQFAKPHITISWPKQTHISAKKLTAEMLQGTGLKPWNPVRNVLKLDEHGQSIFGRKKNLSDKTYERIYHGLVKFVAGGKQNYQQFLLKYNSVNGKTGKHIPPDINEPCPTVTTQARLGICHAQFIQASNGGLATAKIASVDDASRTVTTSDNKALVSPQFISKQFSGHPESKNVSVDDAAPTVKPVDNNMLVTGNFMLNYQHSSEYESIDEPNGTLTTRDKYAFISAYYKSGDNNHSVNGPSPVVRTKGSLSLIEPEQFIARNFTGGGQLSDINEPSGAVMPSPKLNLVSTEPFLMDTQFENSCQSLDKPIGTQTANRKHYYLMNPQFLNKGGDVNAPCFTLIARMDKQPPYLVVTEAGEVAIQVDDTDTPHMVKIKEFMAMYGIVDIKMRMLFVEELLRIQGFPDGYVLEGTQAEKKKYIGNAVEVNQARVILQASASSNLLTKAA